MIETPAAVLGARDLAREADFLVVGLDSLVQYLLAADRENHELRALLRDAAPVRAARAAPDRRRLARRSASRSRCSGSPPCSPQNLPFLLGVGLREFIVPPLNVREFVNEVAQLDVRGAQRAAKTASSSSCQADTLSWVEALRQGYGAV